MAELIKRDAVSNMMKEYFKSIVDSHYYKMDIVDVNAYLQRELDELPSTSEAEIRNEAISEFAERLKRYVDCGHLCSPTEIRWSDLSVVTMIDEIAEQMKGGE